MVYAPDVRRKRSSAHVRESDRISSVYRAGHLHEETGPFFMNRDVIIIGAGASGLMCAIEAGKRGRSVTVIDHAGRAGNKIRVSGGGHCNFSNINADANHYLSENIHFCKSALSGYSYQDITALIEKHGITWHEREEGQLFLKESSGKLNDLLLRECQGAGVQLMMNCRISEICKEEKADRRFRIAAGQQSLSCDSLVIATGGLSFPQLGATDAGYRIARQFSHRVTPLRPALVPLISGERDLKMIRSLSGVSIKAEVRCRERTYKGGFLFTHRGISGPAILQISSYWRRGDEIRINLIPDVDFHAILLARRQSRVELKNLLAAFLPKRFATAWASMNFPSKPLNQYNDKELGNIVSMIQDWRIMPVGTERYDKAEVTSGGVDTTEISSKTMESRIVPGLYFIGEVLDITGELGGYNLHWAWASGHKAGQYV